jgi:hypothetical protein
MHHGFLLGDFRQEGGCDGELAFTEEVHGDGTIYEVFLFGEDIVIGAREGPIFEELKGGWLACSLGERGVDCIGQAGRAL